MEPADHSMSTTTTGVHLPCARTPPWPARTPSRRRCGGRVRQVAKAGREAEALRHACSGIEGSGVPDSLDGATAADPDASARRVDAQRAGRARSRTRRCRRTPRALGARGRHARAACPRTQAVTASPRSRGRSHAARASTVADADVAYSVSPRRRSPGPDVRRFRSRDAAVGTVLVVKPLRAGEGVSYGYTHRAARDTRIALVVGGYAQGIVRALGNRAPVLDRGGAASDRRPGRDGRVRRRRRRAQIAARRRGRLLRRSGCGRAVARRVGRRRPGSLRGELVTRWACARCGSTVRDPRAAGRPRRLRREPRAHPRRGRARRAHARREGRRVRSRPRADHPARVGRAGSAGSAHSMCRPGPPCAPRWATRRASSCGLRLRTTRSATRDRARISISASATSTCCTMSRASRASASPHGARAPQDRHRPAPQRHPSRGVGAPRSTDAAALEARGRRSEVVGVWSHLAEASDDEDDAAAAEFIAAVDAATRAGLRPAVAHLAASAAAFARPEFRHDLVRIGAFAYGIRRPAGPTRRSSASGPSRRSRAPVVRVDDEGVRVAIGALHGLPSTLVGAGRVATPGGPRALLRVDATRERGRGVARSAARRRGDRLRRRERASATTISPRRSARSARRSRCESRRSVAREYRGD